MGCEARVKLKREKEKLIKKELCILCGKSFRGPRDLRRHQLAVHSDKTFSCDVCDFKTATEFGLENHKAYKHEGKGHMCDQCDFVSRVKAGLMKHIQEKHEENALPKERIKCTWANCEKDYPERAYEGPHWREALQVQTL